MNTSKRIGWWIIWLCILSLVMDVVVGSANGVHGGLDLKLMLWWIYGTLAILVIGIFMVQYEPNEEE